MPHPIHDQDLGRRRALGLIGGALGATILASRAHAAGVGVPGTSASPAAAACIATPQGEIGPFFVDDRPPGFERSLLLANLDGTDPQRGVALTLHLYVVDARRGCAPMPGVQVDIWHCNAVGAYSAEGMLGTDGASWLRGYQRSDAGGLVTFKTIVPGWYDGRATHIHVRMRAAGDPGAAGVEEADTTQLFFPQTLVDTLSRSVAPYSTRGINSITNAGDRVYTEETRGEMLLCLSGDATRGFTGTFTLALPVSRA